jgi:ATP-dependent helicase HrpB
MPGDASRPGPGFDLARIGSGLPAAELATPLQEAFEAQTPASLVIEAPPGSGKTTLVPPAVANLVPGRVLVAEPRRIAARAAARRLAQLTGTRLGDLSGFSVRGERAVGPGTRVEFVTAGLLLRRLLADPELPGVGAVILDEVHERGLDADLAFALTTQIAQLRGDLTVAAMSATLDASRWAAFLGADARVLRVPMRPHPLTTHWAPPPRGVTRLDGHGVTRAFLAHVAATTARALDEHAEGSVLVFLPGRREVDAVTALLHEAGIPAEALWGGMSSAEQDRVLAGPAGVERRVIVATSVAESSLTVPGVRIVVDAGLAREPRLDSRRGLSGLVTVPVSQASAAQRAGRAARLGPGVVVRCYSKQSLATAPAEPRPEILTADLTGTALLLAAWGDPDATDLSLPDRPPAAALLAAQHTLVALGALEEVPARAHTAGGVGLRITDRGRRMAQVPAHPRLARALLDGAAEVGADRAAEIVAALNSEVHAPGADLGALLVGLRRGGTPAARRWRQDARRFGTLVSGARQQASTRKRLRDEEALGLLVALGWPEQIALLREGGTYLLASGTGAALPRDSALHGSRWLAVAEASRAHTRDATGAVIRAAVPIDEQVALRAGAALVSSRSVSVWRNGRLRTREVRALGAIELSSTPVTLPLAEARGEILHLLSGAESADPPADVPLGILHWSESAAVLRARLALLHRILGDPWPAMDAAALAGRLDDWLTPEIDRLAAGAPAEQLDLTDALRRLLPWPEATRLEELVPERLRVPSGSLIRVRYPEAGQAAPPVLAVKLQECFGWEHTPRLVDGRVPVLLHLLSPAQRPLAITDDLASFWENAYPQVRADMRGRYPKHPWPEDPRSARPTRHTTHPHRPER